MNDMDNEMVTPTISTLNDPLAPVNAIPEIDKGCDRIRLKPEVTELVNEIKDQTGISNSAKAIQIACQAYLDAGLSNTYPECREAINTIQRGYAVIQNGLRSILDYGVSADSAAHEKYRIMLENSQRSIESVKSEAERLANELKDAKIEKANAERDASDAKKAESDAKAQFDKIEAALTHLQTDLKAKDDNIQALSINLADAAAKLDGYEKLKDDYTAAQAELQQAHAEISSLKQAAAAEAKQHELKQQNTLSMAESKMNAYKATLDATKVDLERKHASEITERDRIQQDLEKKLIRAEDMIAQLTEKIESNQKISDLTIVTLQDEVSRLKGKA